MDTPNLELIAVGCGWIPKLASFYFVDSADKFYIPCYELYVALPAE